MFRLCEPLVGVLDAPKPGERTTQVAKHDYAAALASAERAAQIYRTTSSADWKIAIADSVTPRLTAISGAPKTAGAILARSSAGPRILGAPRRRTCLPAASR